MISVVILSFSNNTDENSIDLLSTRMAKGDTLRIQSTFKGCFENRTEIAQVIRTEKGLGINQANQWRRKNGKHSQEHECNTTNSRL